VLGLVGLFTSFCCTLFGLPLPILAIALGIFSFLNISKRPRELTGQPLAIGGIASGAVSLLLMIILFAANIGGSLLRNAF
jgi:hypothetical protein